MKTVDFSGNLYEIATLKTQTIPFFMKRYLPAFFLISFFLISCGASKKADRSKGNISEHHETKAPAGSTAKKIVDYALKYKGAPYRYGGTTKKGMDCSGLVYISFQNEHISLPRTSRAMSLEGKRLKLKEVNVGDLLFFQTDKNRKVVNHVGLVVKVSGKEISFIHSTSSRGVIVSTLDQAYWNEAFLMARKVL